MTKPNGLVIYRGPSMLDGAPIIVIAIGLATGSANEKTGAMIQTHIMREDMQPTDAIKQGADASICGDCVHRGDGSGKGRTCYVNVGQGPLQVYRAYHRGNYPLHDMTASLVPFRGRVVRFGSYGDPAAVPAWIWSAIAEVCTAHTGYTHQWRKSDALKSVCMASVDTEAEAVVARAAGWRTFRVALQNQTARMKSEAVCPASAEAGKKLTCADCTMCHGAAKGLRGSIVIQAHGGFGVMANVRARTVSMQLV